MILLKRFSFLLMVLVAFNTYAQDEVIDKVVAIVGEDMVLYSEVETQYLQYMLQSGTFVDDPDMRCAVFEEMLISKLMLTQARIDSLEVTDKQINSRIDQKLNYYVMQFGTKEEFEKYYGKTVEEFKSEFYETTREQILIEQVRRNIVGDVKVNPSEVRKFYKDIPKDSLPLIPSEYVIGQIVKIPVVSEKSRNDARTKLEGLRNRIVAGEDFALLAELYSDDKESAKQGGSLGTFTRGVMDPVFEQAAYDLKEEGEVSPIIESAFGFHIIQLIKRSGDYVSARHILIMPKTDFADQLKAERDLKNIKALIEMDSISFEDAAAKFSDDPSGNNGGKLVNPYTGSSSFTADQIDPAVAYTIEKLKVGAVSKPVIMITDNGQTAYRLLFLYKKTPQHLADLERDYDKIQNAALNFKQNEVLDEWIMKKVRDTYFHVIDKDFLGCDLDYEWFK